MKPDKKDMPSKGRILYLTCRDYLEQWDEIAAIFSKNAILKGSFDKYARDKRGKRGTAQVDSAFLEEIAGWREILARNMACEIRSWTPGNSLCSSGDGQPHSLPQDMRGPGD